MEVQGYLVPIRDLEIRGVQTMNHLELFFFLVPVRGVLSTPTLRIPGKS